MKDSEPDTVQQIEDAVRQYQRQRYDRAQQERRKARWRKIWLWAVGVGIVTIPLLSWRLFIAYQEIMRQRVAMRFVAAVVHGDGKTICELSTPEDVKKLNLSPEKVEQALNGLWKGLGTVQVHHILQVPWMPNQEDPEEQTWFVYWGDSSGKVLPASPPEDQLFSNVIVAPTPDGFRVKTGAFFSTTSVVRWGFTDGPKTFVSIRRAARLYSGNPPVWTPPIMPPSVPEHLRPKSGVWYTSSEKGRGK